MLVRPLNPPKLDKSACPAPSAWNAVRDQFFMLFNFTNQRSRLIYNSLGAITA